MHQELNLLFIFIVVVTVMIMALKMRDYRDNGPKWKLNTLTYGGFAIVYLALTGVMWAGMPARGYDLLWIVDGAKIWYQILTGGLTA